MFYLLVKYLIFYATFINHHQAVNRFIGIKNLSKLSSIAQLKRNSCQKIWIRCISNLFPFSVTVAVLDKGLCCQHLQVLLKVEHPQYIWFLITPYIRILDFDWLIASVFSYLGLISFIFTAARGFNFFTLACIKPANSFRIFLLYLYT